MKITISINVELKTLHSIKSMLHIGWRREGDQQQEG